MTTKSGEEKQCLTFRYAIVVSRTEAAICIMRIDKNVGGVRFS